MGMCQREKKKGEREREIVIATESKRQFRK